MKNIALLSLISLLVFVACMDDDDTITSGEVDFQLDFRAEFSGEPLAIQSAAYDYPTGADLKVQLFQYYVSDLQLLPADGGTPVELSDIELIRWMSATEEATTSRSFRVPAGSYSGLRFGLGVSPDLNATDPNNFRADFVLNENEFWNANARYVFAKIEANADLEPDGLFDTSLTYHMGADALYTTVDLAQPLVLDGNGDPEVTVVADVLRALSNGTDTFDISDPNQQRVHGGNQAVATDIWNRLAAQFTLEVR
ncbi:MAG: MbnP family protein [Bacteroidota bacterium]